MRPLDPAGGRRLAVATATARVALGVVAITAPGLPLRPWVGSEAAVQAAPRLLAQALGGRDLALGAGALAALGAGRPALTWVLTAGLADAVDAAATVVHWSRLPQGGRVAVLAAAAGGVLSAALTVTSGAVV